MRGGGGPRFGILLEDRNSKGSNQHLLCSRLAKVQSSGPTEELGVYSVPVPANYPSRLQLPANSAVPQTGGINRNPPISVEVSRGIEYTTGGGGILIGHYTD